MGWFPPNPSSVAIAGRVIEISITKPAFVFRRREIEFGSRIPPPPAKHKLDFPSSQSYNSDRIT